MAAFVPRLFENKVPTLSFGYSGAIIISGIDTTVDSISLRSSRSLRKFLVLSSPLELGIVVSLLSLVAFIF